MALSGTFYGPWLGSGYQRVYLYWSATQNIANNTSTITASLVWDNNAGESLSSNVAKDASVSIGGVTAGSTSTAVVGISAHTTRTIVTGSRTVAHNADGTLNLAISGTFGIKFTLGGTYYASTSASGTATLNTIPRVSSITSVVGGELGSPVTVNISPASDSFRHKVWYKRTDGSEIQLAEYATTGVTFTPALSDAALIPNANSGSALIIVHTFMGDTFIGYTTKSFTVTVPSSVVPTVNHTITGVDTYNGKYVQTYSKVAVSVADSGAQGSSIVSRTTTVVAGTTTISSSSATSFTSGTLQSAGTVTIKSTVRDSRGRSASKTSTITVNQYVPPQITRGTAFRCDANGAANPGGSYINISATAVVSPIDNVNGKILTAKYKARGGSWQTLASDNTSYNLSVSVIAPADPDYSYTVEFYAGDHYIGTTLTREVPTAFVLMDFHSSGKSMAIGRISEGRGVLDIVGDVFFNNIQGYIVEEGTNLGGTYIRFGNGFQITWGKVAVNGTSGVEHLIAASFASSDYVVVFNPIGIASGSTGGMYLGEGVVVDRYTIRLKSLMISANFLNPSPVNMAFIAVGRYK